MRPPELVRTEREITLGMAKPATCTQRLLPMLREAAAVRLAARHERRHRTPPGPGAAPARRRRLGAAAARPCRSRRIATRPASRSAGSAPSSTRWSASDAAGRAADAGGADPRRGRARRRRQARRARADPARAPRRRPRPARGLPRPGEDADRALVRAGDVAPLRAHPVHAGPDAVRRDRLVDLRPAPRASSRSCRARSSPTSSSPTRSTAPRRRRRRRCSRRCRSGR